MYEIIHNGITVGYCDKLRYVREKDGIFISATSDNATHIVLKDNNYSVDETEIAEKTDGEVLTRANEIQIISEQDITELEITSIEQDQALTDAEIAIIELQEKVGEINA